MTDTQRAELKRVAEILCSLSNEELKDYIISNLDAVAEKGKMDLVAYQVWNTTGIMPTVSAHINTKQ